MKRGEERVAKAKEEWLLEVSFTILCYIILGWEGDSHFIPFSVKLAKKETRFLGGNFHQESQWTALQSTWFIVVPWHLLGPIASVGIREAPIFFHHYYNHCIKIRLGHALNDSLLCKQWSISHALLGHIPFDYTLRMEDDSACELTQEQIHQQCTTHAARNNSVPRTENDVWMYYGVVILP